MTTTSDTGGHAALLELNGKPTKAPIKVTFTDKPDATVVVEKFPLPEKFGTYAMILTRGKLRQFLGTLARVPEPLPTATPDNTPILGDGSFFGGGGTVADRMRALNHMGITSARTELSWSENKAGVYSWDRYDPLFDAAAANNVRLFVTLGGHPQWTWPFGEPTPAAGWTPQTGGYSGTGDWLCTPDLYPRYGKWITAFVQRYWKDGKGGLYALENYNEPWEGGGISGWARDCLQYRTIQKLIWDSAKAVTPDIKIAAASSIMNTEDKLFSDGSKQFEKYIDIFTDHYVPPCQCYGPMVAKSHGKVSTESETWFVNTEYLLPQAVAQFLASGQKHLAPWHPRVVFDSVPGSNDDYFIPTPVAAATAACNHFVSGKEFDKLVFRDRMPWVFQFGADTDKDAVLIVFGQLTPVGTDDPKALLWSQVNSSEGGKMTIDNHDGLLQFYDLAGNPIYQKQKSVVLPMTIFPTYITCSKGPAAAAERLSKMRIEGKRSVEILPRDFTTAVTDPKASLVVDLHNCLNRAITGTLTAKGPVAIKLAADTREVALSAGETKSVVFPILAGQTADSNLYPYKFSFASGADKADYAEALNVVVAQKLTPAVDANLDDWKKVPAISVVSQLEKVDLSEMARRPWLNLKDQKPDGSFAELKLAYDDNFIYVAAQVNDANPEMNHPRQEGLDPNSFFHTAADDNISPYKEFLAKHPGHSFGEFPYIYNKSPEAPLGFRGDRIQIGFDLTPGWHDLAPDTDRVPYGFHNVPDTDYEYSIYLCADGKPEVWRLLAPGVPRIGDFPREPHGNPTTGPVPGAQAAIRQDGKTRIYEVAIPRTEIKDFPTKPGDTFGFTFEIGMNQGPNIQYGRDKAVCKLNGLSLHPYWEYKYSDSVRWALGQ